MKRILLFLLTNIAVMVVLSITLNILGVNRFAGAGGLNVGMLLVFSAVVGFTGSIISLLVSKPVAKWSTGAQVIDAPQNADEQWLVSTVKRLADKAGIGMPEVAVYEGEPNALRSVAHFTARFRAVTSATDLMPPPPDRRTIANTHAPARISR